MFHWQLVPIMPNDMGERMVNEILRIGTKRLDILVMVSCFALLFEMFITLHSKTKMFMFILV